jgi:Flp pilus assembly protein TadG
MSKLLRRLLHWWHDIKGVAMVEFAILVTVLCLIIAGIIDLGHAFYLQQVVTNASREGARYGVSYHVDANKNRLPPSSLTPSIKDYVLTTLNYKALLPSSPAPDVVATGPGITTGDYGTELDVTVTATKTWFVLDNFIPSLGSTKVLSHTTAMRCE